MEMVSCQQLYSRLSRLFSSISNLLQEVQELKPLRRDGIRPRNDQRDGLQRKVIESK